MGDGFEQVKIQIKKILKKAGKTIRRLGLPIIALVLITIIVVGGLGYEMTRQDGSYVEGDDSNMLYAMSQFTQDVIINYDGTITTKMSAQELWDEMLKNNTRIDEYLDNPQQLLKLLNAEIVTNYPDTRPEGEIGQPLDEDFWDNLNKNVDGKETQGIIKFKRAKDDGTNITMTYVSPQEFQDYIDAYNKSGSEADKQKALKHFTIEKQYAVSSLTAGTITAGTTIEVPEGFGTCYSYMAWQMVTDQTSMQYKLKEQAGMNFDEEGFGIINGRYVIACTTTFGQAGDYIDFYINTASGQIVLPCIIGDIKNQDDEGCNQWGHINGQCVIEFVVDQGSWYGKKENPGTASNHPEWAGKVVKAVNGGSYFDNPNFGADSDIKPNDSDKDDKDEKDDSKSDSGTLVWPTTTTNISSYFGPRAQPTAGASTNHKGIDIAVGRGNDVYAAEAGIVTHSGDYGTGGLAIIIDHEGGFQTKYLHNDQLLVNVGDKVERGQVIAKSGNTGNSTGPHLHFETLQNGVNIDPLSLKYDNAMGSGTGTYGNGGNAKTKYVVKVATWSERYEEVVAGGDGSVDPDPVIAYKDGETTYTMTAQTVDYQSMVSGYQMPVDYLWQWIVTGRDKDFGLDIAELIFGSEIEITVHDNVTKVTDVDTYDYTRKTKYHTHDIVVDGSWTDTVTTTTSTGSTGSSGTGTTGGTTTSTSTTSGSIHEEDKAGRKEEKLDKYIIIHTTITTTDTLNVSVTKADVWIVEYTQEFEYQQQNMPTVTNGPTAMQQNRDYPPSPDNSDNSDPAGIGAAFEQQVRAKYSDKDTVNTSMTCITDYYYGFDGTVTNQNTTESKKYTALPKELKPKDDPHAEEDNFVTILKEREHHDTLTNVMSAPDWLFDLIKENEKTVDMLDITKYLLYKASGKDYGVTEFDFSVFDPANFKTVSGINGRLSVTTTNLTREEFIAAVQGYSAAINKGAGTQVFRDNAGVIYDVCVKNNINPVLCAAQAWKEQNWDDPSTSPFNYWGIAVYNGQNYGNSYSSMEDAVEGYCRQINSQLNGDLKPIYQARAAEFATVNNKFKGDMSTMYDIFSAYAYIGDGHTLKEEADYAAAYVDSLIQCATQIFGEGALVASSGGASGIIATCQEVMQEFLNRNARYSLTNLIWGDIERCWTDSECICCASYVSLVLYRSGALTPEQINAYNYHYTGDGGLPDMLEAAGWQQVPTSQAQPGDVVIDYSVHAMIYAGDGQVWDQTCCVISSSGNPPVRGTRSYNISGCQIWRAP